MQKVRAVSVDSLAVAIQVVVAVATDVRALIDDGDVMTSFGTLTRNYDSCETSANNENVHGRCVLRVLSIRSYPSESQKKGRLLKAAGSHRGDRKIRS